ncbi:WXG100 family type VII secretion target [Paenibacillus sp. KS-LC4]|uniref:WXG100 family type VII secretion target n=1 Tax=Paenibacillus sp. KS-LC4 TaxID=2979727 RepID=UPI0030CF6192
MQVTQSLADGWKQIQAEGQEVLDGFQEKTAQLENLLSEGLTNGKQIVIEGYNQAETWLNDMYADLEPTLSQGKQGFYNFSGGFIAAVDDAMFFGLAQHVVESNNEGSGMAKDTVGYQLGKVTGDTVMLVGALIAMAGGIGGELGGTALYATGFGALAGAPIQVASWGLLVGGGTVVVQSGKNIPGDVSDLFSNIWKSDSGPKGKGDIDVPKVDIEGTGQGPNVGSIVKDGSKTRYTNPAGNELTWVDQHPKNISRDIETFLNSPNIGKATEGKVAKFVSEQKEVTGFGQKVQRADKTPAGDFDVLTKDEIIEVKASASALKVDQIEKYIKTNHKDFLNPENRKVIVYIEEPLVNLAPEQLQKLNKIKSMGAIVVNSLEELKGVLK